MWLAAPPWLYSSQNDACLILVDPVIENSVIEYISGRKYEIYKCAWGDKKSVEKLYYNRNHPALSSLYERSELTRREDASMERQSVQVYTLEAVLKKSAFPLNKIGLKIDTEGSDLSIIKGAGSFIKDLSFIITEVSVKERFLDSYTFSELITYYYSKGLDLMEIMSVNGPKNSVRLIDALFYPRN